LQRMTTMILKSGFCLRKKKMNIPNNLYPRTYEMKELV
jgi:hypothetical protein